MHVYDSFFNIESIIGPLAKITGVEILVTVSSPRCSSLALFKHNYKMPDAYYSTTCLVRIMAELHGALG